jgi:hypothetical protein
VVDIHTVQKVERGQELTLKYTCYTDSDDDVTQNVSAQLEGLCILMDCYRVHVVITFFRVSDLKLASLIIFENNEDASFLMLFRSVAPFCSIWRVFDVLQEVSQTRATGCLRHPGFQLRLLCLESSFLHLAVFVRQHPHSLMDTSSGFADGIGCKLLGPG